MQQFRRLVFPAITLCFLLVIGGYYLGRRSVDGVILTTQRASEVTESTAARSLSPAAILESDSRTGLLDLNRATLEELMELPGIGEVRARQILDYIAENGPFRQASDLMKVEGIGEGIFAGLRDLVFVEDSDENTDH